MPPRPRRTTASKAADEPLTYRTARWPERSCRDMVPGEYANHSCDVVESHHGPHASASVPESVRLRAAWERNNPDRVEPRAADPFI